MELNGQVPNWEPMFQEDETGVGFTAKIALNRGDAETWISLESYCELLGKSLYGGHEELCLLSHMYKLQVNVYFENEVGFPSSEMDEPLNYRQFPDLDINDPLNAGNLFCCMHILFVM